MAPATARATWRLGRGRSRSLLRSELLRQPTAPTALRPVAPGGTGRPCRIRGPVLGLNRLSRRRDDVCIDKGCVVEGDVLVGAAFALHGGGVVEGNVAADDQREVTGLAAGVGAAGPAGRRGRARPVRARRRAARAGPDRGPAAVVAVAAAAAAAAAAADDRSTCQAGGAAYAGGAAVAGAAADTGGARGRRLGNKDVAREGQIRAVALRADLGVGRREAGARRLGRAIRLVPRLGIGVGRAQHRVVLVGRGRRRQWPLRPVSCVEMAELVNDVADTDGREAGRQAGLAGRCGAARRGHHGGVWNGLDREAQRPERRVKRGCWLRNVM
ncbi:hypothetical protein CAUPRSCDRAFT_11017 [Caulochytrium protostelioides]|uniref:Uncharacterized protein n=1 Tax=Caulochytrium protostelioides TaxID=1555241 RepID=A0A4P9X098_9FUNG|nr:hypothetical protein CAUPRSCDRAFT_11017 [Caulochytrium protostelioides]